MKTLARILIATVILLSIAVPAAEAGIRIRPNASVGEVLLAIGKSERTFNGSTMAEFYTSLRNAGGTEGLEMVISAAIKEKGRAPSMNHVVRALGRVAGALKLSAHNLTIPQFLKELPKLQEQFKNDPESLVTLNRMLVGLTTKVRQSGVHELPVFTHSLGTSAELAECSRLLPAIQKLGPQVGGRKWIEALCNGTVTVAGKPVGMADEWMLEVKCWPKFAGKNARERLITQAKSTYLRLKGSEIKQIDIDAVSGVVDGPGYVVRFAAAGHPSENLGAHRGAIEEGVRKALEEIALIKFPLGIPPAVREGINKFCGAKVSVEMVD